MVFDRFLYEYRPWKVKCDSSFGTYSSVASQTSTLSTFTIKFTCRVELLLHLASSVVVPLHIWRDLDFYKRASLKWFVAEKGNHWVPGLFCSRSTCFLLTLNWRSLRTMCWVHWIRSSHTWYYVWVYDFDSPRVDLFEMALIWGNMENHGTQSGFLDKAYVSCLLWKLFCSLFGTLVKVAWLLGAWLFSSYLHK